MLNLKSLREQVYQYLREELQNGNILPGAHINMGELCKKLNVSKTPLREALIFLEAEGFVTILPRRGVLVNQLTLKDVRELIQVVGSLEASAILSAAARIDKLVLKRLARLNEKMTAAVHREDFENYYRLNAEFHDVFLKRCDNKLLRKTVLLFKQRLYDFPRRAYIREWELINCGEHDQIIACLERGDAGGAARIMQDAHWSYSRHEKYIRQFYLNITHEIQVELAARSRAGIGA